MTIEVDLTVEEARKLQTAKIDVTQLLRGVVASLPENDTAYQTTVPSSGRLALYLSERLQNEKADTFEAGEAAQAELDVFKTQMNESRIKAGAEPVF